MIGTVEWILKAVKPHLHVQLFTVLSPAWAEHIKAQYVTNGLHVNKRLQIHCNNTDAIRVFQYSSYRLMQMSPAFHVSQ